MPTRLAAGMAGLALLMLGAGCSSAPDAAAACRCPKPVVYDEATLKQITAALEALPPGNILHRAMEDYEYERDDLRHCR